MANKNQRKRKARQRRFKTERNKRGQDKKVRRERNQVHNQRVAYEDHRKWLKEQDKQKSDEAVATQLFGDAKMEPVKAKDDADDIQCHCGDTFKTVSDYDDHVASEHPLG